MCDVCKVSRVKDVCAQCAVCCVPYCVCCVQHAISKTDKNTVSVGKDLLFKYFIERLIAPLVSARSLADWHPRGMAAYLNNLKLQLPVRFTELSPCIGFCDINVVSMTWGEPFATTSSIWQRTGRPLGANTSQYFLDFPIFDYHVGPRSSRTKNFSAPCFPSPHGDLHYQSYQLLRFCSQYHDQPST